MTSKITKCKIVDVATNVLEDVRTYAQVLIKQTEFRIRIEFPDLSQEVATGVMTAELNWGQQPHDCYEDKKYLEYFRIRNFDYTGPLPEELMEAIERGFRAELIRGRLVFLFQKKPGNRLLLETLTYTP